MIPVSLPSVEFVVLVFTLLAITIIWLVWTLFLCGRWLLSLRNPQFAKGKWRIVTVLIYWVGMAVALFTIGAFLNFKRQTNEYLSTYNRQYRPVLDTPQRLGGIDMPAGTQLELALADQKEAFRVASFPSPVLVAGVNALKVERYLYIAAEKQEEATLFEPQTMYVSGLGTATQNGWHCDATYPLQFSLKSDGSDLTFSNCTLAEGNHIEGGQVPMGSEVSFSAGTVYVDGFVDNDRWILNFPEAAVIEIDGLPLKGPVVRLDDQLKIYQVDRATLARDTVFGGVNYQSGAIVRFNSRVVRPTYPQSWLIQVSQQQMLSSNEKHMVHDRSGALLTLLP